MSVRGFSFNNTILRQKQSFYFTIILKNRNYYMRKRIISLVAAAMCITLCGTAGAQTKEPVDYVNPYIGNILVNFTGFIICA